MGKPRAVALKYRKDDSAPKIVAKGERNIAAQILKIARQNGIHIEQDAFLTESLMQFDVGEYIPEELYEVIAQLLAFVYKLKIGGRHE